MAQRAAGGVSACDAGRGGALAAPLSAVGGAGLRGRARVQPFSTPSASGSHGRGGRMHARVRPPGNFPSARPKTLPDTAQRCSHRLRARRLGDFGLPAGARRGLGPQAARTRGKLVGRHLRTTDNEPCPLYQIFEKKNSQQARGRPRKTILRLPPAAGGHGTPQTPTD